MKTKARGKVYADGIYIGDALDMEYTTLDGEEAVVTSIPAGHDEVIVPLTVSNIDAFMEAYRKVVPLSDAQIFAEYVACGGVSGPEDFDILNVLSCTMVRVGQASYAYALIVFEDGSIWTP